MKFYLILVISILCLIYSCKLLSPDKDTTSPNVNVTIAGGNEISRSVTLYLDIEDDSKIDYVSVIIDDTTAITVNTNFDTIRFDVTPFADESEHQLYAKVADREGNIGESEKIDIVITEYPGWRIYSDIRLYGSEMTVDENGLIWMARADQINIFDPINNTIRTLTSQNSELPGGWFYSFATIDGSRIWIASINYISEYHYDLNRWIKVIPIPSDPINNEIPEIGSIVLDKDFNLFIGTVNSPSYYKYNGVDFSFYPRSQVYQPFKMVLHPDGSIYVGGDPGIDVFKDDQIKSFDDFPYFSSWDIGCLVIDIHGDVWTEGGHNGGTYRFNGNTWENIHIPVNDPTKIALDHAYPLHVDQIGTMYFEIFTRVFDNQIGYTYKSRGIVTFDGLAWIYWDKFDTPFNPELSDIDNINILNTGLFEAPNGDFWMIAGEKLMRYRPSLGGYP